MKKYLFLFEIGVLLGLISCHMKINCPEFKEESLSWIPYQTNDVIELYSQLKDSTILFSINSVEITHTTDYKSGYDCGGCDDRIEINQNNHDNPKFQVEISLSKNETYQRYWIGDTYFYQEEPYYFEHKDYQFDNQKYENVRIFEKIDSKGTYKSLIVAKDFGIIGLIDIYGNTWTLKINVKIRRLNERDRGNIVINNVSGC
jgi:hypothetical protein